jgi:hypothetical protein
VKSHPSLPCGSRIRIKSLGIWLALCLIWAAPAVSEPLAYDTPEWKKEISHGYLPYHQLARADFRVDDKAYPRWAMYTSAFFHYNYRYDCVGKHQVTARITEWRIRSGFNRNKSSRKSWFKNVEGLLPHEQGHLDINELYSRRLARLSLDALPTGTGETSEEAIDDLKSKLKELATRVSKEDQVEQDAYDAETSHGTDKLKQKEATTALQKRLRQAGISYASELGDDQPSTTAEPKTPLELLGRRLKQKPD